MILEDGHEVKPQVHEYMRPAHAPRRIMWKDTPCFFDMVAPLTGDWIYKGVRDTSVVIHVIVKRGTKRRP